MKLIALLAVAMVAVSAASSWAVGPPERQVAITMDDLPAGAADRMSGTAIDDMTAKLVGTLRDQKVPAVGFVNSGKLFKWGEADTRIKALQIWLDNRDALSDPAYGMPETYVGEEGTGWLDHWAITQSKPPQGARYFRNG